MAEQFRFTPVLQALISEMVRMLITYEIQLEAYSIVLTTAQERITEANIPWDLEANIEKIVNSAALQAMAEAEYAPFAALLQKVSPENFEIALASIRRTIDRHNNRIPLGQ